MCGWIGGGVGVGCFGPRGLSVTLAHAGICVCRKNAYNERRGLWVRSMHATVGLRMWEIGEGEGRGIPSQHFFIHGANSRSVGL